MVYNPLNCAGWETATGFMTFGPCMKARMGFVILFFIIAIARKWGGEEMGVHFSFLFALIFGLIPYLIVIFILGSFKIALVIGIIGSLVGGYSAGFFGGGEGGYE